jgi:hypothetical protein
VCCCIPFPFSRDIREIGSPLWSSLELLGCRPAFRLHSSRDVVFIKNQRRHTHTHTHTKHYTRDGREKWGLGM